MMDDPRLQFAVNIYPARVDKFLTLAQGYVHLASSFIYVAGPPLLSLLFLAVV